jgi:hypothetical protein
MKSETLVFGSQEKIILVIFLMGITTSFLPYANGYLISKSNLDLYLEHGLIVLGKVLSLRDVVDDSNLTPRTAYQIVILQHIKGKTETSEITVVGLGSLNSTRQLDNQTILSKGQHGLLMLTKDTGGNWAISPYSVFSDSLNPDEQFILSPLKLYNAGVSIGDIHCKSNLKFALKSSNDNPVCIAPESKDKLFKRGWIT